MSDLDDTYQAVRSLAHFEAHQALTDLAEQGQAVNLEHLLIAVFMSGFHQAVVLALRHPATCNRLAVALAVVGELDQGDQADLDSNADNLARMATAGLN